MARQPELALGVGSVNLAGVSSRQGRRSVIALAPECTGAERVVIEGVDEPIPDADGDPQTFTLAIEDIGLGTRAAELDCGGGQVAAFDLFVYRQAGGGRGGATASALLIVGGLLGLAMAFALTTSET